jgi:hypothetical protein
LDYILHVNPALHEKGLLMVYNPTPATIRKELAIPLYYSGLTTSARISDHDGTEKIYELDRDYAVHVPVEVPGNGYTWLVMH